MNKKKCISIFIKISTPHPSGTSYSIRRIDMKDQNQNDIICFQEHKICYTEREAGSIVNDCKKHNYHSRGVGQKYKPMRKYFCKDCGFYHLTHLKSYVFEAEQFKHRDREFYEYR